MYGFGGVGAVRIGEQRIDIDRVELVRAMAELARYRHAALLPKDVAHFLGTERTQKASDPPLAAAAFKAHRSAAEEPQIVTGETLHQEFLDAVLPQASTAS